MNARATRGPQRGAGRRPTHNRIAGNRRITAPPSIPPGTGPKPPGGGCVVVLLVTGSLGLISAVIGSAYAGGWLS